MALLSAGIVILCGSVVIGPAAAVGSLSVLDATFTSTGSLGMARYAHTATLLPSGKVLVVGGLGSSGAALSSAEPYDPVTGTWTPTGSLGAARELHTATLLPSGKVLVAAGYNGNSYLSSAELYDPATGNWTATGSLGVPRYAHTAALLSSGKVLVAAGLGSGAVPLTSAELYTPATGTWSATGSLGTPRYDHTATLLPSGKVLVAGGRGAGVSFFLSSAELYDPVSGMWTATGNLATGRLRHTATLLPSGRVLVTAGFGGSAGGSTLSSAELYDPAAGNWTGTGSLRDARYHHSATLLSSSKVLVPGGVGNSGFLNTAELYDPTAGMWTTTANLGTARHSHTATLLPSGKVLVAGGYNLSGPLSSAELYDSAGGTTPTPTPTTTASPTPTPSVPSVTTNPVTNVASFSATLHGSVNPNGMNTTVHFQYGTTTSYGSTTANQTFTGNRTQNVAANISNLTARTTYHFRIVASNMAGTSMGGDRTFTTLTVTGPPVATTSPATNITASSAILHGSLDPHGLSTTVRFQYGTTTSYGHTTAMQTQTGSTYRNIAANISTLVAHTTYHFRIVAHNSGGTRMGGDRSFSTP